MPSPDRGSEGRLRSTWSSPPVAFIPTAARVVRSRLFG
jgi:hypothetical protein